mmetsp:Transcript_58653/g.174548  ORF Transcript_58653/g.174548 Transcript_58653/m.174548 type:complete len:149 (+) Transcript_58653:357-803(+)
MPSSELLDPSSEMEYFEVLFEGMREFEPEAFREVRDPFRELEDTGLSLLPDPPLRVDILVLDRGLAGVVISCPSRSRVEERLPELPLELLEFDSLERERPRLVGEAGKEVEPWRGKSCCVKRRVTVLGLSVDGEGLLPLPPSLTGDFG